MEGSCHVFKPICLGNCRFLFALFLGIPETLVATLCTLGVMETFARQWNGSKQFRLRDLFMLTTAVAIAFSFVATDRGLAIKSSDSTVVPRMWVQIAGIFGLACVIYAIALIIEYALKHPEDFRKVPENRQSMDHQEPDWLSTPEEALSLANKNKKTP